MAVTGGYSVFRVLERLPEGVRPFARARSRARALLLKRRQEEAFAQFVAQLREKYKSQVVVYPEELTKALPDSSLRKSRGV